MRAEQFPILIGKVFRQGDFDTDGDVDSFDRTLLVQNWTGALNEFAPINVVPEPSSLTALMLATILVILGTRLHFRRRM